MIEDICTERNDSQLQSMGFYTKCVFSEPVSLVNLQERIVGTEVNLTTPQAVFRVVLSSEPGEGTRGHDEQCTNFLPSVASALFMRVLAITVLLNGFCVSSFQPVRSSGWVATVWAWRPTTKCHGGCARGPESDLSPFASIRSFAFDQPRETHSHMLFKNTTVASGQLPGYYTVDILAAR
jgi:hypothetical protein